MDHLFLIVEGQSEEKFYKSTFADFMRPEFYIDVVVMPGKKNLTSRKNKGGNIKYDVCIQNVKRFLRSSTHSKFVALIYDYYGLDESFSWGYNGPDDSTERANYIKSRLEADVNDGRFVFFLQMHEFEAYLFSNPSKIAQHYNRMDLEDELQAILDAFQSNPEKINKHRDTSPSHRLIKLFPKYQYGKTTDGVVIASSVGIERIKEKCAGFRNFIEQLKS